LTVADWAAVQKLVAAHQGQVVVVDVWSTSCQPCMAEFPQLVKLHRELGPSVACISVSADYDGIPSKPPESYRGRVLEFLTQQRATFENVLCSDYVYDVLGIGSIPAVYVYDRSGQQVKVFADPADGQEFTYEKDIRPFVQSLLASP
jgi:thiol-disulfide isomerase/thioredoxin